MAGVLFVHFLSLHAQLATSELEPREFDILVVLERQVERLVDVVVLTRGQIDKLVLS